MNAGRFKKKYYILGLIAIAVVASSVFAYVKSTLVRNYVYRVYEKVNRYSDSETIHYTNASYARQPIAADWTVPKDEDLSLLEDELRRILPNGIESVSPEDRSIAILKYVSNSLRLKSNTGPVTKMMKEGFTLCGGMAGTFVMLCRTAGIPARYGAAKYMPTFSEHFVAEAFYDGKWHLFDPTFGFFFYSRPEYDKQGDIISFHEFLANPNRWTAFKIVSKPWKGEYDQDAQLFEVTPVEPDYLKEKYGEPVLEVYKKEMAEAFPVAFGRNDTVSYPVDADLSANEDLWFGERDESYDDLILLTTKLATRYKAQFFGSHYVGEYANPGYHTWVVSGTAGTEVTIEYFALEENPPVLNFVPVRAAKVLDTVTDGKKVTAVFRMSDEQAILSVYCATGTFFIDAMHITRHPRE